MKKIIALSALSVVFIFLAGCGQQQTTQDQPVKKNDTVKTDQQVQPSIDTLSWNIYKNEKYNFTINYPAGWVADDEETLAGPGFRPNNLSVQDIQAGKIDQDNDCFFNIAFLQISQDKQIPCKNNLGEVTLGANKFTKCNLAGFRYMTLHPKTNNIFSFEYIDNPSCKAIFEKSLETLKFN